MQLSTGQATTNKSSDSMSQVNLKSGYWFYFEHEGNDISVFGSAWSGKERVYLNNQEVSSVRNLTSRVANHEFTQGKNNYRAEVKLTSFITGEVTVSLFCNGELLEVESKTYTKTKGSKWVLLFSAIAGGLFGFAVAKYFIG